MAGKFRQIMLLLFSFCFLGPNPDSAIPSVFAQAEGDFKMRVDVELVTVEVTALDKKGKSARNLKMADFQLYEDGKKQDILSLDEVSAESGGSALGMSPLAANFQHRGKTVFIIFDDSAISPQNIKTSRDTAERFVREHMRPQDSFAVAEYGISMTVLQSFTSDREQVLSAIRQPAGSVAGSALYFENLLRSLEKIFQAIAQIKGQKSILIYSQSGFSSGYSTPTLGATYAKTLDMAKKSDIVIYTLSPEIFGDSSGSGGSMMPPMAPAGSMGRGGGMGAISSMGPAVTLRSIATESGGYSIYNTNNFDNELDGFDQQISNFYVLGFQSNNPKHDGAFRKLEIKTTAKGVNLKFKPGYQDRRPVDVLASSKQEKTLMTALASPGAATQLPVAFRPAYFYDSPRSARVLISAKIQTDKMTFKKKGGQLGADINIMGVAYAEDGSVAARFSETLPISFDKEKEAEFKKANMPYHNYFKLRPGKYHLKLAVSDESNNLGATEQALEIPAIPEQGFVASSIVVAEQLSKLPELIKNLQTQLLDQSDPLLYSGVQVEPSIENKLPVNSAVSLLFRLYNLPGRADQRDLVANPRLVDDKGGNFALAPIQLKDAMSNVSPTEAVVGLRLPFQNVPAGKYRLIIETKETASSQAATLQTDLEFVQ